jgi:hypothetical protein
MPNIDCDPAQIQAGHCKSQIQAALTIDKHLIHSILIHEKMETDNGLHHTAN